HLREFLTSGTKLDAIFALNNHIAIALLTCLKKKEFAKYKDVQIACFDDITTFDIVDKKILSVSQPIEDIGKRASTLLLNIIGGTNKEKSNIVLTTKLVVR